MTTQLPDDVKTILSASILSALDMSSIAYIKKLERSRGTGYGLYASDGRELAVYATRDIAMFTARQNELEPVSAH